VAELKPYIRKYLDAADGVMINYSLAPLKLMYNYRFAHEFYRDGMIPVLKSVLSEPKYRNKLLGLEATNLEQMGRRAGAVQVHCFGGYQDQPYERSESADLVMVVEK
jgi:hypothetical protein